MEVNELDFDEVVQKRRAYRSLEKVEITDEQIKELAETAQLAPSCYNNQPWNFVFVRKKDKLEEMYEVMSSTNKWTRNSSMIIAVFSKKDDDCVVKEREYHQFDTGLGTAFLILKATEMGLIAHPIAGFDECETKKTLDIPDEYQVITLVIVGKHSEEIKDELTDSQVKVEKERPDRKNFDGFVYLDKFGKDLD
ncbi:MAG: nitroreductase family protein [Candidatus Saliniplasma sp.]